MKRFPLTALALLCLPFTTTTLAANTPTEDQSLAQLFSRGSEYSNVKISPTGKYLSAITSADGKDVLVVLNAQNKKLINTVYFAGNEQVGDYQWASSERLVFEKVYLEGWTDVPQYYGELMAVNADGSRQTYLFGYDSSGQQTGSNIKKNTAIRATAFILDPLPDDEQYILVNALPWSESTKLDHDLLQDVYRVDLFKGTRKRITTAPIGQAQFMTDHEGEVRFVSGTDIKNNSKLFYRQGSDWVNTDKLNFGLSDLTPISFTDNKNIIFAQGREGTALSAVYRLNLETGEKTKIIQDKVVDPSGFWFNGTNKQLYAVEFENGHPSYAFVDNDDSHAKLLKSLIAALPGHQVRIVSETRDGSTFVVVAFNDRNPGDYYTFDTKKLKLAYLASTRAWLDPEKMAEVKPISFTNRDGQTIYGYLTLPNGKEAKNLPLVVNPHGGPHGVRDWWGFDPENQLLAQHGIAVLQVNFRGSGGYGDNFKELGYQKWGSDIQYDIIDATKYVIEQGFVDKDRICISGGSFGGYSALQSSILAPDLFKCAIGTAGVYDLPLWKKDSDVSESFSGRHYQTDALSNNLDLLKSMSPSYNVSKLKAKLLLIHGGDDKRVPISQLESLEKALKAHNYPYQKMVMDNEGHGFYNDNHRAEYYDQMLSFLKTNLKL
ncbi:alpha/beta hydrolase family protein [Shewanella acanthi]|uniref:alpha/beta hydrolase family protein n=1 Tax=Shewanella acanthi TaxID=2864212 RepID=UPI001C65EE81|nr:S9 family peptidase [Shewanella acanthi]QYJ78565.1 S9 family peptidase [Shewanella acanthi]